MYYYIRICLLILIYSIITFALIKSHKFVLFPKFTNKKIYSKYFTDRKYKWNTLILNVVLLTLCVLLGFVSAYPYEGHFITFDSVKDSLKYKNISMKNTDTYEYDDCVFIVDNTDYTIYSVTKINDRYKLVDFKSDNIEYTQPKIVGYERVTKPISAKFNNDTGKCFYYIGIKTTEKPFYQVTLDNNKMTFCKDAKTQHLSKKMQKDYWIYSYFDNAQPKKKFTIKADDFEAMIYKTPYIKGISDK